MPLHNSSRTYHTVVRQIMQKPRIWKSLALNAIWGFAEFSNIDILIWHDTEKLGTLLLWTRDMFLRWIISNCHFWHVQSNSCQQKCSAMLQKYTPRLCQLGPVAFDTLSLVASHLSKHQRGTGAIKLLEVRQASVIVCGVIGHTSAVSSVLRLCLWDFGHTSN